MRGNNQTALDGRGDRPRFAEASQTTPSRGRRGSRRLRRIHRDAHCAAEDYDVAGSNCRRADGPARQGLPRLLVRARGRPACFEILVNRKNKAWVDKGIFIELVQWEDFLDVMSKTPLQDEYNARIRDCDLFVLLFWTKVGRYTTEEFETGVGQFNAADKPFILLYFKSQPAEDAATRAEPQAGDADAATRLARCG